MIDDAQVSEHQRVFVAEPVSPGLSHFDGHTTSADDFGVGLPLVEGECCDERVIADVE